jgi:hypothetical protein
MAISQLGGVIYTNQNTPVVSHAHQLEQGKALLQNYVAAEIEKEKDERIEETRPAEETSKIKPDDEHEKDKHDQDEENNEEQQEKLKKREQEETQVLSPTGSSGLLDVKV